METFWEIVLKNFAFFSPDIHKFLGLVIFLVEEWVANVEEWVATVEEWVAK